MTLANVTRKQTNKVPCLLGELVGFKNLEDGREAMIVKALDENLRAGEIMTITQGKAPNEELALKRRTVSSFSNINSKNHLKPGAIVRFDQVHISADSKSAEAIFIKDMYSGENDDARSIMVALARPLPARANKDIAWLEVIDPSKKKVVSTTKEFGAALAEAFRDSILFTKGNGISEYSKNIILLTDDENSKPHPIFIRNVVIDESESPQRYRYPKVTELWEQFKSDETIKDVNGLLESQNGKQKINVIPGARILVPTNFAQDSKYEHSIKNHTGRFKINVGDGKVTDGESIGYKKVVIGLWNSVVNSITPVEYTRPTLNEQIATLAIQAQGKINSASLSAEKSLLEEAAASASSAMAALAQQNSNKPKIPEEGYNLAEESIDEHGINNGKGEELKQQINEKSEDDLDEFFNFDNEEAEELNHKSGFDLNVSDSRSSDDEDQAANIFSSMNNS